MPNYTIEITYETGNSFGSREEVDTIGAAWKDLEKAKKALQDIKEHYQYYSSVHGYSSKRKDKDKINKEVKNKRWYIGKYWEFELNVELDNGDKQQISAFWCGYFERLYEAKIVTEEDSELSFNLR